MTPAGAWRLPRRPARAPRWLWAGISTSLLLHMGAVAWLLWQPAATLPHVVEAKGVEMLWQGAADGKGMPQPAPPGAQGDAPASAREARQPAPPVPVPPPAAPPRIAQPAPPVTPPPMPAGAFPEAPPPPPAAPLAPGPATGSPAARPGAMAAAPPAEAFAPALALPPAPPPLADAPAMPIPRYAQAPRSEAPPRPDAPSSGEDPVAAQSLAATDPQPGRASRPVMPTPAPDGPSPAMSRPAPVAPPDGSAGAPARAEAQQVEELPPPAPPQPAPPGHPAPPQAMPMPRPASRAAPPQAAEAPPPVPPAPHVAPEAPGTVRLGAMASLGENRAAEPQDPKCLEAIPYPEEAQRAGWAGRVALRMRITDKGRVIAADVTESSGYPVLDDAARSAAKRCRFDPFLRDGIPAWGTVRTVVEFRARPSSGAR